MVFYYLLRLQGKKSIVVMGGSIGVDDYVGVYLKYQSLLALYAYSRLHSINLSLYFLQ